jgi:uncharacterized membrane protein YbhN (UPF0104 family)
MKKHLRYLGPLLVVLIFAVAVWFLHGILKKHTYAEVRQSVAQISTLWLYAAIGLTLLNYVILVGYDLLAVRYIGERLALWKVALASFTGYAFSYNVGATFAGTTVRYRLYSAWGVSPMKILQLLVILGLTIWFGLFFLAGVVFIYDPLTIPAGIPLCFHNTRIVGIVLLGVAVAYLGASACHKGTVTLWRWKLPVPPFKLTLYQVGVASADLLVAAGVLYALLPSMAGIDYPKFLGIYMLAYVAAVLSHMPGGYAVFDGVVLAFLPEEYESAGIAALLVFRVIYYWVPLLLAAALLAGHEFVLRRHWFAAMAEGMCRCGRRPLSEPPPAGCSEAAALAQDCCGRNGGAAACQGVTPPDAVRPRS